MNGQRENRFLGKISENGGARHKERGKRAQKTVG